MSDAIQLFDTHAHLDFPKLRENLPAVLERAADAGVERIVAIGASDGLQSNHRALQIAKEHDSIRCSAGIHPHDADACTDEVFELIVDDFSSHPQVVAIGETGLDYYYDNAPRDTQQRVFRRFVDLAAQLQKPVIIHSRDAEEDTIDILRQSGHRRGILHCFSGSADFAQAALDLGYHISFSGIATFNSATDILDIASEVPADRLLVETDAPFLAPVPKRGETNEPAFVRHTAEAIAQARGVSLAELANTTFQNACELYDWPL